MKKQTLIITSLPNGMQEENGQTFLKVSLHLSFRLSSDVTTTLSAFPDVLNWHEKLQKGGFQFQVNKGEPITGDFQTLHFSPNLWSPLFHSDIQVKGYEPENFNNVRIHSYPSKHVTDFVFKTYKRYASRFPDRVPSPEDFEKDDELGRITPYRMKEPKRPPATTAVIPPSLLEKDYLEKDQQGKERLKGMLRKRGYFPYNKMPNPAMDFVQFRDFHQLDKPPLTSPPTPILPPGFEFHDIQSVISQYPVLQRKLGFVLDFLIPLPESFPNHGTLRAKPQGFSWEVETEMVTPLTAFLKTPKGFYLRGRKGSEISKGFLKINTSSFTLFQTDTDGAALKLANLTDNSVQKRVKKRMVELDLDRSTKVKGRQKQEPEEPEGLPPIRSAGVAISRNGMAGHLFEKIELREKIQLDHIDNAIDDPDTGTKTSNKILFAEDVTQGYRMDAAYEEAPEKWFSLHWRQDAYTWHDPDGTPHTIPNEKPDEGFTQSALTQDTQSEKDLYSPETLTRWEGWSLSVPRPGLAINESDDEHPKDYIEKNRDIEQKKYGYHEDLEFRLNAQSKIVPGTLPKLRFGQTYFFRVRVVDLAGNSVPHDIPGELENETLIRNFTYRRHEPVTNPLLLTGTPFKEGETLEHMTLQSGAEISPDDFSSNYPQILADGPVNPLRHLAAPFTSQTMAENHGKFDEALGNNPQKAASFYQVIRSREKVLDPSDQMTHKIYTDPSIPVTWLPDPIAIGATLFTPSGYETTHSPIFIPIIIGYFSNQLLSPGDEQSIEGDQWLNPRSFRITLKEGSYNQEWDPSQRILTISLPKGERIILAYASLWPNNKLKKVSALYRILKDDSPLNISEIEESIQSGRHWMMSPPRQLEITHAVAQPVFPPNIEIINPTRNFGDTLAYLNMRIQVHGYSTGKLDLSAQWEDPIDEPWKFEPELIPGKALLDPFEVDYDEKKLIKGSVPEGDTPDKLAVTKSSQKTRKVSFIPIGQDGIPHRFGDTKHRWVSYQPKGTTRYAEHFSSLGEKATFFTKEGSLFENVNILSTARPTPPEVAYTIPTFEWTYSENKTTFRHTRKGGGLRIFIRRPWYSSGADEKIAVVLPSGSSTTKQIAATVGFNPYRHNLTQWGIDPIKPSTPPQSGFPGLANFRYNPHTEKNLSHPENKNKRVDIAAYPVKFDKERQLWYADISIETGILYFPFIRLALARYQEHSVRSGNRDVCLSPIVRPDFIQVVPDRSATLTLQQEEKNSRFSLTLTGVAPLVRQGLPEHYFEISFLDPELVQPAHGNLDDGSNPKELTEKKIRIPLTGREVSGGRFSISRIFKLSKKYNKEPLEVIIQEFEGGPKTPSSTIGRTSQGLSEENQPRVVYADIFKLNVSN